MYSESFYKIGGALQFLTAGFVIYQTAIPFSENVNGHVDGYALTGLYLIYIVFLLYASATNLLIARSGMPLVQYRSFNLINICAWFIIAIGSFFTLMPVLFGLHTLIFLAFLIAIFTKPKFQ